MDDWKSECFVHFAHQSTYMVHSSARVLLLEGEQAEASLHVHVGVMCAAGV